MRLSTTILITIISLSLACGKKDKNEAPPQLERNKEGGVIKFYNEQHPGKWKDYAWSHSPKVLKKKSRRRTTVEVSVPIASDLGKHYIETILLLSHEKNREIDKVTFKPTDTEFVAQFELPADHQASIYVVAKCNLHDMWEKRLDFHD